LQLKNSFSVDEQYNNSIWRILLHIRSTKESLMY
jgi:hypothetical protein